MGEVIRRVLVRTVRYLVLHRIAAAGFVAAVVVGLVGTLFVAPMLGFGGFGPALPRIGGSSGAGAADDFMRGNREFRADLVWSSFSDEARRRLESQGNGVGALERQMQAARERGVKLEDVSYIGGRDLPDGTTMQFYMVGYRPPGRGDMEYIPYVFTLDKAGKIAKVQ